MPKLTGLYKENRFVVLLVALLAIGGFSSFWFGHDPHKDWIDTLRELSSSLTAEFIGAMIGVLVIDQLLKKHQEQISRRARGLVLSRIRSLGLETVNHSLSMISYSRRDDPVVLAFGEVLEMIRKGDFCSANAKLGDVFSCSALVKHPETFSKIHDMVDGLQPKWTDLQDMFQQYLTADEFASTVEVIERLEWLAFQCRNMGEWVEIVGSIDDFMDLAADTPLEGAMAYELKELNAKVLNLLQLCHPD